MSTTAEILQAQAASIVEQVPVELAEYIQKDHRGLPLAELNLVPELLAGIVNWLQTQIRIPRGLFDDTPPHGTRRTLHLRFRHVDDSSRRPPSCYIELSWVEQQPGTGNVNGNAALVQGILPYVVQAGRQVYGRQFQVPATHQWQSISTQTKDLLFVARVVVNALRNDYRVDGMSLAGTVIPPRSTGLVPAANPHTTLAWLHSVTVDNALRLEIAFPGNGELLLTQVWDGEESVVTVQGRHITGSRNINLANSLFRRPYTSVYDEPIDSSVKLSEDDNSVISWATDGNQELDYKYWQQVVLAADRFALPVASGKFGSVPFTGGVADLDSGTDPVNFGETDAVLPKDLSNLVLSYMELGGRMKASRDTKEYTNDVDEYRNADKIHRDTKAELIERTVQWLQTAEEDGWDNLRENALVVKAEGHPHALWVSMVWSPTNDPAVPVDVDQNIAVPYIAIHYYQRTLPEKAMKTVQDIITRAVRKKLTHVHHRTQHHGSMRSKAWCLRPRTTQQECRETLARIVLALKWSELQVDLTWMPNHFAVPIGAAGRCMLDKPATGL